MIDLSALVSLRAVDATGSVSAAAETLGYTPSAVSQQIKRLERQAGVALLERVGRGVMLTGPGRRLVEEGAALLLDLEQIEAGLLAEAGTVSGRLRVTAFSTAMRGMVAPAVAALLSDHPDLEVTLTESEPFEAVDLVAAGQADVAVVHSWGDQALETPDHVDPVPVGRDVADVLVPAGHRLAGRTRVSPHDLVDEGWIATPEGSICRRWLSRMHDGTGRPPRIVHQAFEFESHVAMVEAGLGVALVPRLGRQPLPPGVVAVAVHRPVPERTITALSRRSMGTSPAVRAVLTALGRTG